MENNSKIINMDSSGRMNMEVPIYLDSKKVLMIITDAVEILDALYLVCASTTAKDLRRMLRFQRDGDKVNLL